MKVNVPSFEGSVSRDYFRIGNGKRVKDFPWTRLPFGKVGKYVICRIVVDLVGGDLDSIEIMRNFKKQGITKEKVYQLFIARMPWFPEYFHSYNGGILTPLIVYNRWHKGLMYRNSMPKGQRCQRSDEHYHSFRSSLRAIAPMAEKLYLEKAVITKEDIITAGIK